jgi:subtilisin family serine protease
MCPPDGVSDRAEGITTDAADTGAADVEGSGLSRRTFMRATGVAAGASLLGVGATGTAAAEEGFHREFANPRTWELSRVWERGYRGRPDRTVAVGDTGVDARHPDLAWNRVRIVEGEDELDLQKVTNVDTGGESVGDIGPYTGTLGPGVADAGETERDTYELDVPAGANEVEATATWTPQRQDNELLLLDENGNVVASSTEFNPLSGAGERLRGPVEPGYAIAIETYANVAADYELTGTFIENDTTVESLPEDHDPIPEGPVDPDTPSLVGWKGSTLARDGDGHGSHTSSISAGTGQASAIDESTVVEEEPRAALLPGEFLSYEVTPVGGKAESREEGGVFAGVYGENLVVEIEGPDGRTVEETSLASDSSASGDVTVAETHAARAGTYTVYVKPSETVTSAARVKRASVGALLPPAETTGDRLGETPTLHAGAAPNASLVTIQGLGNALGALSTYPDFFTGKFGVRTANFSFGGLQTERLGLSDTYFFVRDMAKGGILTVSSAGNFGPLTGSTGPSGADEAIAAAATGPMDGLTAYTSGGTVVRGNGDDDETDGSNDSPAGEIYRKPDVTAPGGTLDDAVNAVRAESPDSDGPVRGYVGFSGTSMAAPYTNGVAGLLAQAMEEDAPDGLSLPTPEETGYEDVLRLKGIVLATASETPFIAAPYHRAHAPTYEFGGRDPYEGFGRVNPDAAIDAVTREFSAVGSDTVGLNRHADSRAVAGYLAPEEAVTYRLSVEFSHLSGGNKGAAQGDPHVDLFVYDAANPSENGIPTIVAKAQGLEGSPALSFAGEAGGAYVVVAKLVDVPGVFNGDDVQAHLDMGVEVDDRFVVTGTRNDDGSAFTGGQTNQIDVSVEANDPVVVRDRVPKEWDVLTEHSDDVARVVPGTEFDFVYFDTDGDGVTDGDDLAEASAFTYFAEAPEGATLTNAYEFGPVEVNTDADAGNRAGSWVAVPGTSSTEYVLGTST